MENSLAPGLLIAMPQLVDPNFAKSVVLLVHHDEDGAMGLVVNRRADVALGSFCEAHDIPYGGGLDRSLHVGGPCEHQRGFMLHDEPALAANHLEIVPGVLLSTEAQAVRAVLERGQRPYCFLLGYSGWGAGQLEREIAEGAWLNAPATARRILTPAVERLWMSVLGDLGVDPARLVVSNERH
jgi:putative transcriptional regulator